MNKFNIYDNLEYDENKIKITPMIDNDFFKEIRIVFKKNQVIKDHKTAYPIAVEVFDGEIDFGLCDEVHNLKKGDIISLEGNIIHNLKANEDSIIRLTLNKGDSINRVKGVLKL